DAEILGELSQEETVWFSELTLNSVEYSNTNKAFSVILKDVEECFHKKRRRQLEKEILLMADGKKEKDNTLFEEYKRLTALLKGSGN
ncbi:MAG: hypothetical protein LBD17_02805, partial [Endomicrobium sp.]|nr:hypothetical protein [Endomicrobium sp.]